MCSLSCFIGRWEILYTIYVHQTVDLTTSESVKSRQPVPHELATSSQLRDRIACKVAAAALYDSDSRLRPEAESREILDSLGRPIRRPPAPHPVGQHFLDHLTT